MVIRLFSLCLVALRGGIWSSAESRGYYWASGVDDEFEAVCAEIGRYIEPSVFSIARYNGCSVRPLINLGNDKLEEYRAMLVKTKGKTIEFDLRKVAEVTLEYRAYEQRDYVDLGLTSGMLWATTNIGAEAPEDFGDYYAWGEVQTKRLYEYYTYRYGEDMKEMTKYCTDSEYGKDGFTDGLTALEADDDAAIRLWGKGWRMPEAKDFDELIAECNWEWTELNGVFGYRVTSRVNENSIFLPAAGWFSVELILDETGTYLSSSLSQEFGNYAYSLYFDEDFYLRDSGARQEGYSIRPVHPKLEE